MIVHSEVKVDYASFNPSFYWHESLLSSSVYIMVILILQEATLFYVAYLFQKKLISFFVWPA